MEVEVEELYSKRGQLFRDLSVTNLKDQGGKRERNEGEILDIPSLVTEHPIKISFQCHVIPVP